jgi:predicted DNA-binding protein
VRISLRAAPELRAKLEHQAKREGRRVSDVARDALERYVS